MVGKPDTAVGILWVVSTLIIFNGFVRKESNNIDFFIILLTSLFAFQLKVNSGPLFILIIFYMIYFKNTINLFQKNNLYLYIIAFLYLVKNFLISGCVIYPLNITCIPTAGWLNFPHIRESSYITIRDNRRLRLDDGFTEWFNNFFSHAYNEQIYKNLLLTLIIIFCFNKVFYKRPVKNTGLKIFYLIYLILNYALFLLTVPAFRNGYGLFMSTILIFTISENPIKKSFQILFNRYTYFTLILIICVLLPRSFMYSDAISNNLELKDFEMGTSTYTNFDESYVFPNENNQCWKKQNCILKTQHNVDIKTSKINNYLIIKSNG